MAATGGGGRSRGEGCGGEEDIREGKRDEEEYDIMRPKVVVQGENRPDHAGIGHFPARTQFQQITTGALTRQGRDHFVTTIDSYDLEHRALPTSNRNSLSFDTIYNPYFWVFRTLVFSISRCSIWRQSTEHTKSVNHAIFEEKLYILKKSYIHNFKSSRYILCIGLLSALFRILHQHVFQKTYSGKFSILGDRQIKRALKFSYKNNTIKKIMTISTITISLKH